MRKSGGWLSALFVLGSLQLVSAQFALHNGDRVVFYGDSITDNAPYATDIELFVLTRYPQMNVRFFNAGVGGDRVTGGGLGPIDLRLSRDLLSRKPTVVTVMLGMNDGNYQAFNQVALDTYRNGMSHIVERVRAEAPGARIWLMEPSPFDDVTRAYSGYNDVLKKYGAADAELAKSLGLGSIDLNAPVNDALARAVVIDPNLAQKILADRVHPWLAGHLVMATAILQAWGAQSIVSRTEIDATNGKTISDGATLRKVHVGDTIRWTSTEDSLPFPINRKDEPTALVLRTSPIEDTLGRELLMVHKLAPGTYKLSIDGQEVARFPADTFNSGIDLSWIDTPMSKQAFRVADWTQKRVALKYMAWRTIEVGLSALPPKPLEESLHAIDRLEDDLIKRQHEEAIPKPHTFEVTRL